MAEHAPHSAGLLPSRALHRFAVATAAATFVLIFVGGLVTSTGSALSVPDWPLAFGHLIPKLIGGVRFEWSHRLVAGIVSILTLILALWTCFAEHRRWLRNLALAAFALVIAQAVLGGITVLYGLPLPIAVAHAVTGQTFFCVVVAMAIFTSPAFVARQRMKTDYARPSLPILASITTAVVYLQIIIGAVMRHLGAGLAIPDFPFAFGHLIPPHFDEFIAVNFAHRCGAVVVTIFVIWTAARVLRYFSDEVRLRRRAVGLLVLLVVQISLGALTVLSQRAVIPTTAHVAIGAAVLATSLSLAIRAWALTGLASASVPAKVPTPLTQAVAR